MTDRSLMRYEIPNAYFWNKVDNATIEKLAQESIKSTRIMRTEPNNSGFSMEDAVNILESLVEDDEDVSDIVPDVLE